MEQDRFRLTDFKAVVNKVEEKFFQYQNSNIEILKMHDEELT